jgi:hypothetical protein
MPPGVPLWPIRAIGVPGSAPEKFFQKVALLRWSVAGAVAVLPNSGSDKAGPFYAPRWRGLAVGLPTATTLRATACAQADVRGAEQPSTFS